LSGTSPTARRRDRLRGAGLAFEARHRQALSRFEPALRTAVKQAGFVTREPRVVERKKYGRAEARTQLPVLEALSFDNNGYAKGRPGYPRPPFPYPASLLADR
jgi:hypothetical protein